MSLPTVYVVDDCVLNHLFYKMFLKEVGMEIQLRTFLDPLLGLKDLVLEPKPCLVLLDINMPELTGWEFLEAIQDHAVEHAVVIASSSPTKEDKKNLAKHKHIMFYINKPFNKKIILKVLNEALHSLQKNLNVQLNKPS